MNEMETKLLPFNFNIFEDNPKRHGIEKGFRNVRKFFTNIANLVNGFILRGSGLVQLLSDSLFSLPSPSKTHPGTLFLSLPHSITYFVYSHQLKGEN